MNTNAPAIGGASGSGSQQPLHSAWNPYSVLPPAARRKIDTTDTTDSSPSYLTSLSIPPTVASERLSSKFLQLDAPVGKVSDRRKAELAKESLEKAKRASRNCGLVGRRKRVKLPEGGKKDVRYESILPIHQLWLQYMAELLLLPILLLSPHQADLAPPTTSTTTSTLIPTFPPRPSDDKAPPIADLKLNVPALHVKLVKAEFVGCILSVKRAKNPSLVGIKGIVLQETLGTFKLVTSSSLIKIIPKKGSIFTFTLPLQSQENEKRDISFDIFGDAFSYRAAERVNRKWKAGSGAGGVELF